MIAAAIVGGAVIPPLMRRLADTVGLRGALTLPALCHVLIAAYGLHATKRTRAG